MRSTLRGYIKLKVAILENIPERSSYAVPTCTKPPWSSKKKNYSPEMKVKKEKQCSTCITQPINQPHGWPPLDGAFLFSLYGENVAAKKRKKKRFANFGSKVLLRERPCLIRHGSFLQSRSGEKPSNRIGKQEIENVYFPSSLPNTCAGAIMQPLQEILPQSL